MALAFRGKNTVVASLAILGLFLATALPATAYARDTDTTPPKQWVWLTDEGVWGYGYQLQEGPYRGLWEIDESTKRPPAWDPYGFAAVLNRYRAAHGLPPVAYDPSLSAWAAQNNVAQCRHGIGHHVVPNCCQNSGWNYASAEDVAAGWMNSPGHRATMLMPSMSRFGIAYGPGPYWTMNAM